MEVCTSSKKTAAGLDNWEPAELGMLSLTTFDWLAKLLNMVEDGRPWPDGLQHSKAAYLSKDQNRTDDPLAYRVLMILPASYRRWGTLRLKHLQPWTEKWGLPEMYAGVGSQGAEDAWYALAIHIGHLNLLDEDYTGGTVDIAKCFDQINRELVEQLAIRAGMPRGILSAYMRFQEALLVHNSVAGGIGQGFLRRTGIPQGCPLSMLHMALIMRPWIVMQQIDGNFPKTLADDILLLTTGEERRLQRFAKGLDATHTYLLDLGAKIAPDKNLNFCSTSEGRKWLKQTLWEKIDAAIEVVDNFRYLGAHMNISCRNTAETLRKRIRNGTAMLAKVARLPVDRAH